jgi:hypothetical protein
MSGNKLRLLIDKNYLPMLKASQQRITLARQVNSAMPDVVWQAIDPSVSTEVEWDAQYGFYASNVSVMHGARITKIAEADIPVRDGGRYSFTRDMVFAGPSGGGVARGSYAIDNDMPFSSYPVLTFGLTQSARINQRPSGPHPISATPVLATQPLTMTPLPDVCLWMESGASSETVISRIDGPYSVVRFSGGANEITLKYDPNLGVFVSASPRGELQHDSELVELNAAPAG